MSCLHLFVTMKRFHTIALRYSLRADIFQHCNKTPSCKDAHYSYFMMKIMPENVSKYIENRRI